MKNLFFLIIIVTATIVSQAQDKAKKTPEDKARNKTTEMVTSLKLTKEQEKEAQKKRDTLEIEEQRKILIKEEKKTSEI